MTRMCRYCPEPATARGLCARHLRQDHYQPLRLNRRPPAARRRAGAPVYDREWARVSRAWLAEHPLCEACKKEGRAVPAEVVDHIRPVRYFPELKFAASNFQSLCTRRPYSCHQRKTGFERRGIALDFARRKQIRFVERMRGKRA